MVKGYLIADFNRYGALCLSDSSRALLRGETSFYYREVSAETSPRKAKPKASNSVSEADRALWDALRECRKQLATEHNVAPYMIFHDATLMQMMEERPQSSHALSFIHGVGESKLEKYGDTFLAIIRDFD